MSEVQTILSDLDAAFVRIEAHIKNLFENGAPHQKVMHDDLKLITDHAKGIAPTAVTDPAFAQEAAAKLSKANVDLATANGKLLNLQSNIDNLLTVCDSLQTQLEQAQSKLVADEARIHELEAELATAKSPMSAAADPVGGRVASGVVTFDPITGAAIQS